MCCAARAALDDGVDAHATSRVHHKLVFEHEQFLDVPRDQVDHGSRPCLCVCTPFDSPDRSFERLVFMFIRALQIEALQQDVVTGHQSRRFPGGFPIRISESQLALVNND